MSTLIDLTPEDLEGILHFTSGLARKAGSLIMEGSVAIQMAPPEDVLEKKNSVDLVTDYDVRVEELVKKALEHRYPYYKFMGEESYAGGSRASLTDAPTFCVDPIDGTTNFIHGLPYVCISIGLIYKRRPVLGVIYNPFLDMLYTGVKGQGSRLAHRGGSPRRLPLSSHPKPLPSLHEALIAVEWGSDRKKVAMDAKSASFVRLAGNPAQGIVGGKMAHSLRSMGSAALNYAMVAQGGLDMYWEIGCWPWDVCAGIVIAEEAGCVVVGSHKSFATAGDNFGDVAEEVLTGRKHLVVRAIADTPNETGREAQKRIIQEFYDSVQDFDAN